MKHAVLIMAHKNKVQLIRLIRTLACEEFDFFVHPDINWNLTDEDLKDIESCADHVHLASKRIHGELDHWSLVQITLNLIDDAMDNEKVTGICYSYFLLLSGQDYPIKSKKYILDFLKEQYPKPLIHIDSYEDEEWVRRKFILVRWADKVDRIYKRMKPSIIRKIRVAPYAFSDKVERCFYGEPYERVSRFGLKLYGGSAWWILPHGVIDYIVTVRKSNPKFIKEYARTLTPEETFFQTMTMNSEYQHYYVSHDDIYDYGYGDLPCLTYADFYSETKQFRGHPHIVVSDDYDRIMAKKALFARKFDTDVDETVLDMIDKVIVDR